MQVLRIIHVRHCRLNLNRASHSPCQLGRPLSFVVQVTTVSSFHRHLENGRIRMSKIKLSSCMPPGVLFVVLALLAGCGAKNPATPRSPSSASTIPQDEREKPILSDLVQLTRDFDRAGEAYFSPDMKWI